MTGRAHNSASENEGVQTSGSYDTVTGKVDNREQAGGTVHNHCGGTNTGTQAHTVTGGLRFGGGK